MSHAGFLQSLIESLHFPKIEVFGSGCAENCKVQRWRRRNPNRKTGAAGDDPRDTPRATNSGLQCQTSAARKASRVDPAVVDRKPFLGILDNRAPGFSRR